MMNKEEYRLYFEKWRKYIRFAPILSETGIPKANFSQFLSGSNTNALSAEKLEMIKSKMEEIFGEIGQEVAEDGQNIL